MSEDRAGQTAPDPDDLDPELPEDELPEDGEDAGSEAEVDEADAGAEPEPQQRQQPKESRAERRIRQLSEQNREQRDRLARLEGQIQAPRPQAPAVDPAVEERQFYESIALMAPEQMAQAISRRMQAQFDQRSQRTELFLGDRLDKQDFSALQRDEPAARRLSAQVEQLLVAERQNGRNPNRETIYNYLIGQEVRAKGQRAATQQRRVGQQRIARETTALGSSRSTAQPAADRRGKEETHAELKDRLKNIVW